MLGCQLVKALPGAGLSGNQVRNQKATISRHGLTENYEVQFLETHEAGNTQFSNLKGRSNSMKITKNMKAALEFLGEPYEVKKIDFESCLYRNLNTGFDIEVSGINRPPKGYVCNFVQVWDIRIDSYYHAKTVEKVYDIKTLQELKEVLDQLCKKYG